MPKLGITREEEEANKYNITKFVKQKHRDVLLQRAESYQVNLDQDEKYKQGSEEDVESEPN
jgi:hypothetical protein